MSVDFSDPSSGAGNPAGAMIARAAAASARARVGVRAAAADLATPDAVRLDDEAREAVRAELDRLVGAIEADLRTYAGRNGRAAAALAPSEGLVARMIAAGLLEDEGLTGELVDRAWSGIIAARLPLAAALDDDRPSLLPRLANGPDRVVASAASAMLAAEARRRGGSADAGRDDLPAELHHRLVWWTAAALRPAAPSGAADFALADGARRALAAHDEGARIEAAAERLVLALDPDEAALPGFVDAALDDRRLVLLAAVLAHAAGLDPAAMRSILVDPASERLGLVLRAVGLPREMVVRIGLALAEADRRREPGRFIETIEPLLAISQAAAADAVAAFKLPAVYRDARAALERAA